MKKIFLTLAALLLANAAFAECALFVEDFEVKQSELGTEIVVPVKAHFSARLNAWQLELTLPAGILATEAEAGTDQRVTYINHEGKERRLRPNFSGLSSTNRTLAYFMDEGYWQDPNGEDPSVWTPYGLIKWEGGDYNEMILLHLYIRADFKGGNITFNTLASSTSDSRGGTILENGDENVHFKRVCHVTVEASSDPIEVEAPVINSTMDDDNVYVSIEWPESTGERIYTGEYTYPRGEQDAEYEVEAYVAANEPYLESEHAVKTIVVPAKDGGTPPNHTTGAWVVFIDKDGNPIYYELMPGDEDNLIMTTYLSLSYSIFGEPASEDESNVDFYFLVDGVMYGADENEKEPIYGYSNENLLVEGENCWAVPAGHKYLIGILTDSETGDMYMLISMGIVIGVNETMDGKSVAGVRYYNIAGQEMKEADGMTIVLTTYTDGTTTATKVRK